MRGTRADRRDRWLIAAVPVLLALVALTQVGLATTTDLTPWRGAGFGMFSTLDGHDLRGVRVEVVEADGERLAIPGRSLRRGSDELDRALVRARAWPTDARVDELGRAIAAADLVEVSGGRAEPRAALDPDPDEDASQIIRPVDDVAQVDIEIHRIRFDRPSREVVPEVIAERTVRP